MPRHAILFLGIVLCCTAAAAQIVVAPHEAAPTFNPETKKALPTSAELALDAAKRWTEAALEDASNLPPIERDFLSVRIAKTWNGTDHAQAEEYLKAGLDHMDAYASAQEAAKDADVSEVIGDISSDVMVVDRDAWNRLVKKLPGSDASDLIATEAQTFADQGDSKNAIELERKSLEQGGSQTDLETLYSLIQTNQNSASELFNEIVKTAAKPDSNPDLISGFLRRIQNQGNEVADNFFDQERRQRLAQVVAQRTLGGNHDDACNFSLEASPLLSQYDAGTRARIQQIVNDCSRQGFYGQSDGSGSAALRSTDDLVQSMNEAVDAKVKAGLRRRAVEHAVLDGDDERAIRLCLEASPQERQGDVFPFDRFDIRASNLAWRAASTALRNHDDLKFQSILAALPPGLKAQLEINAIRFTSKDKVQSLLMLSDARNILQHELPTQTTTYFFMLSETTQLAPEDITVSWRVLGNGLNRFAQHMKTAQSHVGMTQSEAYVNPIYPWFMPEKALTAEGLVRAIVGDLTSPEFRACLRLTVIQAFLLRYTDAIQQLQSQRPKGITAKN